MALSDSRTAHRACHGVGVATSDRNGPPPITRTTIPTCRAHYPGGSERVHASVASPSHAAFPEQTGGSASTTSLSRPAQTSLALRPAGSLSRPRRPLSRGFETASYPTAPLVSYQINRQLSGWYLPPLVFRAFGAHCPLMATSRHSMGYAKESALTPKADVRGPMSAFPPISSALHLGADVLVTCPRLPVMTQSGHFGCPSQGSDFIILQLNVSLF